MGNAPTKEQQGRDAHTNGGLRLLSLGKHGGKLRAKLKAAASRKTKAKRALSSAARTASPPSSARNFLHAINLDVYTQAFVMAGYDDDSSNPAALAGLTAADLARVQRAARVPILPHHQALILEASQQLQHILAEQAAAVGAPKAAPGDSRPGAAAAAAAVPSPAPVAAANAPAAPPASEVAAAAADVAAADAAPAEPAAVAGATMPGFPDLHTPVLDEGHQHQMQLQDDETRPPPQQQQQTQTQTQQRQHHNHHQTQAEDDTTSEEEEEQGQGQQDAGTAPGAQEACSPGAATPARLPPEIVGSGSGGTGTQELPGSTPGQRPLARSPNPYSQQASCSSIGSGSRMGARGGMLSASKPSSCASRRAVVAPAVPAAAAAVAGGSAAAGSPGSLVRCTTAAGASGRLSSRGRAGPQRPPAAAASAVASPAAPRPPWSLAGRSSSSSGGGGTPRRAQPSSMRSPPPSRAATGAAVAASRTPAAGSRQAARGSRAAATGSSRNSSSSSSSRPAAASPAAGSAARRGSAGAGGVAEEPAKHSPPPKSPVAGQRSEAAAAPRTPAAPHESHGSPGPAASAADEGAAEHAAVPAAGGAAALGGGSNNGDGSICKPARPSTAAAAADAAAAASAVTQVAPAVHLDRAAAANGGPPQHTGGGSGSGSSSSGGDDSITAAMPVSVPPAPGTAVLSGLPEAASAPTARSPRGQAELQPAVQQQGEEHLGQAAAADTYSCPPDSLALKPGTSSAAAAALVRAAAAAEMAVATAVAASTTQQPPAPTSASGGLLPGLSEIEPAGSEDDAQVGRVGACIAAGSPCATPPEVVAAAAAAAGGRLRHEACFWEGGSEVHPSPGNHNPFMDEAALAPAAAAPAAADAAAAVAAALDAAAGEGCFNPFLVADVDAAQQPHNAVAATAAAAAPAAAPGLRRQLSEPIFAAGRPLAGVAGAQEQQQHSRQQLSQHCSSQHAGLHAAGGNATVGGGGMQPKSACGASLAGSDCGGPLTLTLRAAAGDAAAAAAAAAGAGPLKPRLRQHARPPVLSSPATTAAAAAAAAAARASGPRGNAGGVWAKLPGTVASQSFAATASLRTQPLPGLARIDAVTSGGAAGKRCALPGARVPPGALTSQAPQLQQHKMMRASSEPGRHKHHLGGSSSIGGGVSSSRTMRATHTSAAGSGQQGSGGGDGSAHACGRDGMRAVEGADPCAAALQQLAQQQANNQAIIRRLLQGAGSGPGGAAGARAATYTALEAAGMEYHHQQHQLLQDTPAHSLDVPWFQPLLVPARVGWGSDAAAMHQLLPGQVVLPGQYPAGAAVLPMPAVMGQPVSQLQHPGAQQQAVWLQQGDPVVGGLGIAQQQQQQQHGHHGFGQQPITAWAGPAGPGQAQHGRMGGGGNTILDLRRPAAAGPHAAAAAAAAGGAPMAQAPAGHMCWAAGQWQPYRQATSEAGNPGGPGSIAGSVDGTRSCVEVGARAADVGSIVDRARAMAARQQQLLMQQQHARSAPAAPARAAAAAAGVAQAAAAHAEHVGPAAATAAPAGAAAAAAEAPDPESHVSDAGSAGGSGAAATAVGAPASGSGSSCLAPIREGDRVLRMMQEYEELSALDRIVKSRMLELLHTASMPAAAACSAAAGPGSAAPAASAAAAALDAAAADAAPAHGSAAGGQPTPRSAAAVAQACPDNSAVPAAVLAVDGAAAAEVSELCDSPVKGAAAHAQHPDQQHKVHGSLHVQQQQQQAGSGGDAARIRTDAGAAAQPRGVWATARQHIMAAIKQQPGSKSAAAAVKALAAAVPADQHEGSSAAAGTGGQATGVPSSGRDVPLKQAAVPADTGVGHRGFSSGAAAPAGALAHNGMAAGAERAEHVHGLMGAAVSAADAAQGGSGVVPPRAAPANP